MHREVLTACTMVETLVKVQSLPSRTVFNADFVVADAISHKKVTDINMTGPFTTGCNAIFAEKNCAFVILECYGIHICETLCFQKVTGP